MIVTDASRALTLSMHYDPETEVFECPDAYALDAIDPDELPAAIRWIAWDFACDGYQSGLEWILGVTDIRDDNPPHRWLLRHGIAPGQRFDVRIRPTIWTGSGEDVDHERGCAKVVWIEPWSPELVRAAWRRWLLGTPEIAFVERGELVTVYEPAPRARPIDIEWPEAFGERMELLAPRPCPEEWLREYINPERHVIGVDMALGPARDTVITLLERRGDHVVLVDHKRSFDVLAQIIQERLVIGPDWLLMLTPKKCSGATYNGCALTRPPRTR